MNLIESVVAGITAGTGGDATAASIASRLELENNQFQLPQGIVRAGAASASLGEFMAKNGASNEEIQQAQTDLLRGLGTDAAQPATALLKSWAILMGAAPSATGGATATLAGMAAGGVIGGTINALAQSALNVEQEMSAVDVLVAIATGAATQGRGIVTIISTSASGAGIGAIVKGEELTSAVIGAVAGAAGGIQAGKIVTKSAKGLVTKGASNTTGAISGALVSEIISSETQAQINEAIKK